METKNSKLKIQNYGIYYFIKHISFAFCILSFAFVLFSLGCARTITQIVTYGDQMTVEVTLRGTMEVNANRYFLILSTSSNYKIPLPPPDLMENAPEFIEPDMTPQVGSPETYYANFYSTWSGYILLDPSGYSLIKGPFVLNQVLSREVFSALEETGTKIKFSLRLGRIFENIPDQIYFDFVAAPWPDGQEKIPADHLPSTNNYIYKVLGSVITVDDSTDSSLDPSLDILNCRIEIQ